MEYIKKLAIDDVENLLTEYLSNHNYSDREINLILDKILAIVVFGSTEKHCHVDDKAGFLWRIKDDVVYHDFDIAIIFDGIDIHLPEGTTVLSKEVTIEYSKGMYTDYKRKLDKPQYFHITLMKDYELKEHIKNNEEHAVAIKNSKRLYVRDLDITKYLFDSVQE